MRIELFDVEILDGFFSGIAVINNASEQIAVEVGYDIEYERLSLHNCDSVAYNPALSEYSDEELEDFIEEYYDDLTQEINSYID